MVRTDTSYLSASSFAGNFIPLHQLVAYSEQTVDHWIPLLFPVDIPGWFLLQAFVPFAPEAGDFQLFLP